MNKKIFFVFLLMMFLIVPMVSATLETKSFDKDKPNHGEIKIKEWLGITNKVDYRLMDYGASVIDVWAEGDYKLYKKTHLFTGVFYKDTFGNRGELREVKFYIWENETKTDYNLTYESQNCRPNTEDTMVGTICDRVLVSNESYNYEEGHWIEYEKGMDLEESEGRWRLEAKRHKNKKVDFVLEGHNKEFTEWAWWDASWNYKAEIQLDSTPTPNDWYEINFTRPANMKADCGDLRILNNSENQELLIKNLNCGATVFVEVALNDTLNPYLYYGNAGAITTSTNFSGVTRSTTLNPNIELTGQLTTWWGGIKITVGGSDVYLKGADMMTGVTATKVYVYNNDGTSLLAQSDISTLHADFDYLLSASTNYQIKANDPISLWTTQRNDGLSFPISMTEVSFIKGLQAQNTEDNARAWNIESLDFQLLDLIGITLGAEEQNAGNVAIDFVTPPTPVNFANISAEEITIEVNVTYTNSTFTNISYDFYNINGTLITDFYTVETLQINITLPESHFHYNVTICANETILGGTVCSSTATQHLNHDITPPEINISSPSEAYDYLYVGEILNLNFTATDNLANLSSCWYNYNGTNNSIACTNGTLVSVDFILENNNNNLTVYSNDSFGNLGSELLSWTYKVLETAKEYNKETLEGTFETFKLYLTKGSGVNVQNVVLHYDGQTDTSSLFSSGSETRAESELFINEVLADTNNTLYFTVTLSDSTVFNTSSAVQLVRNIELDDCSSQPNLLLTLNLLDEANQSAITGDIEIYFSILNPDNFEEVLSFNDSYSSISSKTFCSNILLNESSFLLGAKIRYDSENHSAEFYNIQRSNLSSYPKTYNLYDLKDQDTTKFKLIYRGENLIGVVDAIIQLQREYISEGVYKIVEAPLTSSDSTAVVHIDTNTNSYKATVVKDGVVLNTFDNLVFICQSELTGECTLDLQDYIVPPNSIPVESIQDFSYSISSDIDNKTITLDYSVPTGTTSSITIVATQKDIVGEETICNTTVSSAGGSIECSYNDSIQDSYIYYNIYKDGVQLVQKSYIVKDDLRDDFGGDNYFILIIFTISLVFMAILSPEWIVLNSIIAIIVGGATWLIRGMDFVLGLGAIAWLLLGAIIIIIKMAQKEDQ